MKKWKYNKPIKYEDIKVRKDICWGKEVTLYSLQVDGFGFQSIIIKIIKLMLKIDLYIYLKKHRKKKLLTIYKVKTPPIYKGRWGDD